MSKDGRKLTVMKVERDHENDKSIQNTPEFNEWIWRIRELTGGFVQDFSWRDQFNAGKTPVEAIVHLHKIAGLHSISPEDLRSRS